MAKRFSETRDELSTIANKSYVKMSISTCSSLPQEQAVKTDMLSVVNIQVLWSVEEGVDACI